jgi:beta-lactamase superfamily II metal-dependent hydrolase
MASFEAIFIDVGQGDSTLVRLPGDQYLLVDVCRRQGAGIDTFKLLDDRLPDGSDGRPRLEHLLITHAHDDHICGIGDLAERYEIGTLWIPRYEAGQSLGDNFDEFETVVAAHPEADKRFPEGSRDPIGTLGEGEAVTMYCFSPPGYVSVPEKLTESQQRELVHSECVVVRLDYAGYRLMFAADSNLACWQRVQPYFAAYQDADGEPILRGDLLHASHHGSRTFFTDQGEDSDLWLDALQSIDPVEVVVSVGAKNRFDHPHPEAMDAYRDAVGDDHVYETSQHGTIVVEIEEDGNVQLVIDDGTCADNYAWDEDDGDGSGDDRGGPGGKLAAGALLGTAAALAGAAAVGSRRRRQVRLDDQPAA